MLPPGVQKYQNTSSKLNVSFQTPVGGWLKLHNHDSSHCILSSLKLKHLLFQAQSFTILHRTSSDVIVHAYIDVSFLKLQRYIYTVSIQMHLKWSNLRRGWLMPFFPSHLRAWLNLSWLGTAGICISTTRDSFSSCCTWASFCFRCPICHDNIVIRPILSSLISIFLLPNRKTVTDNFLNTHISCDRDGRTNVA